MRIRRHWERRRRKLALRTLWAWLCRGDLAGEFLSKWERLVRLSRVCRVLLFATATGNSACAANLVSERERLVRLSRVCRVLLLATATGNNACAAKLVSARSLPQSIEKFRCEVAVGILAIVHIWCWGQCLLLPCFVGS